MNARPDPTRRTILLAGLAAAIPLDIQGRLMGAYEQLAGADQTRRDWYRGLPGSGKAVLAAAGAVRDRPVTWWPHDLVDRAAATLHAASVVSVHAGDHDAARTWAVACVHLGTERVSYDARAAGYIALGDAWPDDPGFRLSVLAAARPLSPTVGAMLAAHRASAHATAGSPDEAAHWLDVMDEMLARHHTAGWPTVWQREVSSTYALACRGATSLLAGRLDAAEQAFRQLGWLGPNRLELAEARVHLARVLAGKGELDEAVGLAGEAAGMLLAVSPRARPHVQEVRDAAAARGVRVDALDDALDG